MSQYRPTGILVPAVLLLLLTALAAYPWRLPLGDGFAMPLLALFTVYVCALRYAALPMAPLAFLAGFAYDLFTRAPLGFWALLFVLAAVCANATRDYADRFGPLPGWLCLLLMPPVAGLQAWALSSLYTWQLQPAAPIAGSLAMALLLLPLPVLLLLGLEPMLILRGERRR